MSDRMLTFRQFPWIGGINTSLDEAVIPNNQLTRAENVVFGTNGARKKRDGIKHCYDSISISSVSVANPTVITTSTAHGLTSGDTVTITATGVTPSISSSYTATVTGATTFTIPVNVTAASTPSGTLYSNNSKSVVGGHDFWFGTTSKTQLQVSIMSDGTMYSYNNGTRTQLTVGGTAWSGTLTSASFLTFGNILLIAVSGSTNVMKYWDGNTANSVLDVPGTPPKASILREHLGRVFCNDKANQDRLHYSPTGDYTQWNGVGDSGAIPIMEGDGDPNGLTAIFPTFKSALFVAKKTKLYRVDGLVPEEFFVNKVSDGIGAVSHNSIAPIDQDDIMFVSQKGVHSLAATDQYGDFNSSFVSVDIQKTFNESFNQSRLPYVWAAYLPNLNSVAFTFSSVSSSTNDSLYLYNIPLKSWYSWPSLPCQSAWVANDSDKKRIYLGSTSGRISKTLNGTNYDISTSNANTAIAWRVTTGYIYPSADPSIINAFKQLILYFKPQGTYMVAASVYIDDKTLDTSSNSLSYSQTQTASLLGTTMTLGTSTLGYNGIMGAYGLTIDGVGKGFKLDLSSSGTDEAIEIQGFGVRFEPLGQVMEVI